MRFQLINYLLPSLASTCINCWSVSWRHPGVNMTHRLSDACWNDQIIQNSSWIDSSWPRSAKCAHGISRGRGRKKWGLRRNDPNGAKQPAINKAGRKRKPQRISIRHFYIFDGTRHAVVVKGRVCAISCLTASVNRRLQMSSVGPSMEGLPWTTKRKHIKACQIIAIHLCTSLLSLTNSTEFKEFQTCCISSGGFQTCCISRRWLCNCIPCKHSCSSRKCLHPSVEDHYRPCHTCNKGG